MAREPLVPFGVVAERREERTPTGNPLGIQRLDGKSWNARLNKALLGNPNGTYVNENKTF